MFWIFLGFLPGVFGATGQLCSGSKSQEWTVGNDGTLKSKTSGFCLTAAMYPVQNGTPLMMAECTGNVSQRFDLLANNSIVLQSDERFCANLEGYGTTPGTTVWLFTCSASDCKGNCDWVQNSSANSFQNPESGLCLDDGTPLPHTCAAGSVSAGLPFCDYNLSREERIKDLLSRISLEQKVQEFSVPVSRFVFNSSLNLKGYLWDLTCMRGVAPGRMEPIRNATVFPHAIALGATWNPSLIFDIGRATAVEGRVINELNYNASGGTSFQGVQCDGGPLANSVHDGRWGRIQETYGEDPVLVGAMGTAAILALQNRDLAHDFMETSQVTRHYLGFHGARPDLPNSGEESIDSVFFVDQQEPCYRSFQVDGQAEGIMCAMSSFSIDGGAMIPSCVHPYLWNKLRDEWNSSCFVQTDCCSSLSEMISAHHYFQDYSQAISAAMNIGLQASYGPDENIDKTLFAMVENGSISETLLDSRIARTFETRFRLGEFDTENPNNPFRGPYNVSDLDSDEHHALARRAVAESIVLLHNHDKILPLSPSQSIAVIGPFANCTLLQGGYGGHDKDSPLECSYTQNYGPFASFVSTIVDAVHTRTNNTSTYAQGSNILSALPNGINQAVQVAKQADVVLLCLGLGTLVEGEGLDRTSFLLPQPQQDLLNAISNAVGASKLVLATLSAGGIDIPPSDSGAALQLWYGGQEMGNGLADVLFGDVSPSGKLPLTIYKNQYLDFVPPISDFNMLSSNTTANIGRTYRYLSNSSFIRYSFGHGHHYATFQYSNLQIASKTSPTNVTVSFQLTNTGNNPSLETAQLYLRPPTIPFLKGVQPSFSLVAFQKLQKPLPQSQSQTLQISIPPSAFLSTHRNGSQFLYPGNYTLTVGGTSPTDPDPTSNFVSIPLEL